MINVQDLIKAIKERSKVKINYDVGGARIVLPAALYHHPGTGKLLVDAFQTSGYSESGELLMIFTTKSLKNGRKNNQM